MNATPNADQHRPAARVTSPVAWAAANHWPEYLMEAAELGVFMLSAIIVVALLEYPAWHVAAAVPLPWLRRLFIGLAMGLTATALIYSPLGRRSGAHFNPAVTLTFFRLGKVTTPDAVFYVLAQFAGGVAGVAVGTAVAPRAASSPQVHYVATVPGPAGPWAAFGAEVAMSFALMLTVLLTTNTPAFARFTGAIAGALVALFIFLESPISGMSLNPARTVGSAVVAREWLGIWIYFLAPVLGMLTAAEFYLRALGQDHIQSAKLHHDHRRCIFRCDAHASKPQDRELT